MNYLISFSLLILFIASGCNNSTEKFNSENSLKTSVNKTDQYPHDFMFMQRAYPTGEIKTEAYSNAIDWKGRQLQQRDPSAVWEFAGPVNVGGRISDIEIPVDQAQTYYVGAASGGIFKTTDAGANWIPIFDSQEMLSIGDIEISKNNSDILWVGTGEVNAGGGSLAYDGDGIYRSGDGGISWETKGLPDVGSIGKILIDPNNDNTIFVGAMGPLFRNDTNRGVYRTTDGGTSWEQKLFVSDSTGIIDMAIHPSNGNIVYAASWERIRRPNRRQYGGETSRIYRSVDGGDNWSELTNGLPSNPADKGRISIDISQSNPNVLYAFYSDATGNVFGIFKTSDGGDTWIEVDSNISGTSYHWWFGGLFIDPTDEDIVYYLGFTTDKSTDGGASWSGTFINAHVDQHALAFNPNVPDQVLLGNDGGLYSSANNGSSWIKDATLPITQFYRFYVDPQNGNKIYGGTQDNNTIRTITGGLDDWNPIYGGDGFQPLVDHTNTSVIYALSQNGNLGKSINDAASFMNLGSFGARKNWNTPIIFDPSDSEIVYYGANQLYRTTNAGTNWSAISPDLTNGSGGGNLTFGTIYSIDVSPLNSDVIYVGTDDGNVWITTNGGANWNNISGSLPNRWVTKVLADRGDVNTVYVTFSGYRYGEDDGHVYKSDDAGNTWTDIGTSLPDIPINDIVKDSYGNLFLGTDIGVLASLDEGINWQVLGANMPSVVVTDMHIDETNELLYAATYGRSAYKIDISNNILNLEDELFASEVKLFPNPATDQVRISFTKTFVPTLMVIYDQLGREIKSQVFNRNHGIIEVSLEGIRSGIYYVKLSDGVNQSTKKLIIK